VSETCVICGVRPAHALIPLYHAIPDPLGIPRPGALRQKRLANGETFSVMRDEPWCRECGAKVLARHSGEYIWQNAGNWLR